jgi:hypothetical protein
VHDGRQLLVPADLPRTIERVAASVRRHFSRRGADQEGWRAPVSGEELRALAEAVRPAQ